jgi:hypothetical protein
MHSSALPRRGREIAFKNNFNKWLQGMELMELSYFTLQIEM